MQIEKHFADWDNDRLESWVKYDFSFLGMRRLDNPIAFDKAKKIKSNSERKTLFNSYITNLKQTATLSNQYFVAVHITDIRPFSKEELLSWLENPNVNLFFISGGGVKEQDLYNLPGENLMFEPKSIYSPQMDTQYKETIIDRLLAMIVARDMKFK